MALKALVDSILEELITLDVQSEREASSAWGLKDELRELRRLLARIQPILSDAEEKQIGNEAVKSWLHAMDETANDAKGIVDRFKYEILRLKAAEVAATAGINNMVPCGQVRVFFSSRNHIVFRLKMRRKLKNILKRIEEIESEGKSFNFAFAYELPETTLPNIRETISSAVESYVVGREKDREEIMTVLIENNKNLVVLPIVSMGGIGKTSMAQLVYNDRFVVNHFQLRAWICVSDVWDRKKIIEDIIISITGKKSHLGSMESMEYVVREALMGKRYLIVLDDVWKDDRFEWEALKGILECDGTDGSAIIVTTRSMRVANITGTLQPYNLSLLSESQSWNLFCSTAFTPGTEKPKELVEIGRSIVRKCGGLPLGIKMVGSSLYMKSDIRDWLKIRDSNLWDLSNVYDILPALQLSYTKLPPYSKRCISFCATFPSDYLIEKEMLIQMWIAHGFIPLGDKLDVQGHKIFNQLVRRSFLHDMNERNKGYVCLYAPEKHKDCRHDHFTITNCRMHDLVHDLVLSFVGRSREKSTPKYVYYLSVGDLDNNEMMNEFTNLGTSIEIFDTREVSGNFLKYTLSRFSISTMSLRHLRYLKLSSAQIRELPDYISTLHHLQTLDLFRCYELRKLPESICTLLNLQTLDLRWCTHLCELPKMMQYMSGLRNLYLDRCYKLMKMPARMGRMTNLQTLSMYIVSDEDGRGIDELKGLNLSFKLEIYNLRNVKEAEVARQVKLHSKDLQWLTLCWREVDYVLPSNYEDAAISYLNQDNVIEQLKPPDGINVLKIWDYEGLNFPEWIMGCLHLVELHLGYCTRIHKLPPLWRLNSLEVLSLRRLDNLRCIISNDDDVAEVYTTVKPFPSLKKLTMCSLRSLEDWWENRNAVQYMALCFPSLVDLEIEKCPELAGSMPLLSSVKDLKVKESNKIRLWGFVPNETSSSTNLQGLEKLSIRKCEDVVLIWREMIDSGSCLQDLEIMECDWMFSSRVSGLWRCMASLETLTIFECHALVDMFEMLRGVKSLRKLEILVSLTMPEATSTMDACLPPQLEEFSFFSCESMRTLVLRCPASLRFLDIWGCPNLVSLTAAERELGQLTSLESIKLHDCCKLKSFEIDTGGLAALRHLTITDCIPLMSLPQCLLRCLPRLEQLEIGGCPGLEKKCTSGGEYYHLLSNIPKKSIGREDRGGESSTSHFIVTSRR